jgi:hypothetical protein
MKSPSEIATLWDGKPDTADTVSAALDFVGSNPDIRLGKASTGLGHCLRGMEQHDDIIDHCAGLALGFLGRHSLGRPGLRLMTACMIAEVSEPSSVNGIAAGYLMAEILDDPKMVRFVKHRARLSCEAVMVYALGTNTSRGRRAIPASLLVIQADRNDRPVIPMRDKRDYLELLKSAAAAAGMGDYVARAETMEAKLKERAAIPRCKQAGAGLFYEI